MSEVKALMIEISMVGIKNIYLHQAMIKSFVQFQSSSKLKFIERLISIQFYKVKVKNIGTTLDLSNLVQIVYA